MLSDADQPHTQDAALLLIDLINPFDFPGSESLLEQTRSIIARVVALRDACRHHEIPVIYVNDNFGHWRSSFEETTSACAAKAGGDIVRAITPNENDYFVLKPQRSGFYHTALHLLLRELGVERVFLAGITTDMCVLATANDARMRGYDVWLARDCAAAIDSDRHRTAIEVMSSGLQVTVTESEPILRQIG